MSVFLALPASLNVPKTIAISHESGFRQKYWTGYRCPCIDACHDAGYHDCTVAPELTMNWIRIESPAYWIVAVATFLGVACWESMRPKRPLSASPERRWGNH